MTIEAVDTELHFEIICKHQDTTTIVFESGYGWALDNWNPIVNQVSEFANLFLYDRAGVGQSGDGNFPKHSGQIVQNLRALLKRADVKPPYIFVGHSFGGINIRLYSKIYPEEVSGMVLIDVCHEDQNWRMAPLFSDEVRRIYFGQFTVEGTLQEFEKSLEQVRGTTLGNLPLIVMTGGSQTYHTKESMEVWIEFQQQIAQLSTDSTHYILDKASHAVHMDEPEAVVSAIKEMVEKVNLRR